MHGLRIPIGKTNAIDAGSVWQAILKGRCENYPFFAEIVPHAEQDLNKEVSGAAKPMANKPDIFPEQEGQRCSNNNGFSAVSVWQRVRPHPLKKSVQWKNHRNHQDIPNWPSADRAHRWR